ncbi:C40 family peptidase [Profundibacter sp.]
MNWSDKYIGIPYRDRGRGFDGCDCWGLARLVYARELGIALPSYTEAYSSAEEAAEVAALLDTRNEMATWKIADSPHAFDLILYRHGRLSTHVAILIDARRMLHIQSDDAAKVEDCTDPRWNARFVGIYRHVQTTLKGG